MSLSTRRRDLSPSRSGVGSSKLRMDRQPVVARITDPSLPMGKRKEIDNVMKKARAQTNEYWDKKLLEAEEKDPNRWRHTGYKKMYIEGESSSDSDRESFRINRNRSSRSRSRKSPPTSPATLRRRSPPDVRRRSPASPMARRRSPLDSRRPRSPDVRRRPRSPPEPLLPLRRKSPHSPRSPVVGNTTRRRTPTSPVLRRRSPPPPSSSSSSAAAQHQQQKRTANILPRSKRPPSPPPKTGRTPSNSSLSSCSDDSCSVCSPKNKRGRSRSPSVTIPRSRQGPRSPPPKTLSGNRTGPSLMQSSQSSAQLHSSKTRNQLSTHTLSGRSMRPSSPPAGVRIDEKHGKLSSVKHRIEEKVIYPSEKALQRTGDRNVSRHLIEENHSESVVKRAPRQRSDIPEDPRLKPRPPEPPEPAPLPKKIKDKTEKLQAKVKIEGEKRKKPDTSESDDSSSSENSLPTPTATTRLTLSERFGKMAQWSVDRSNMENMNMRITKDSSGGALKVMLNVDMESPPRRYSYSPAPAGHFPEELATTAPTGLMSWDDVRVRYEYYKSRGYLRDLDLKDYVKWEEWWYRYQEWLKQERYYEFYERQQMHRRRRKKVPITQRLN